MIIFLAAIAMVCQDVLATCLVIAETRGHRLVAGLLDAAQWGAGITTTTVSVTALQGHRLGEKAIVVAAMTVANVGGTYAGVWTGQRLINDRGELDVEARLTALERQLGMRRLP